MDKLTNGIKKTKEKDTMASSAQVKFQWTSKSGTTRTNVRVFRVKQQSDALLQTEVTKAVNREKGSNPMILDIKWK